MRSELATLRDLPRRQRSLLGTLWAMKWEPAAILATVLCTAFIADRLSLFDLDAIGAQFRPFEIAPETVSLSFPLCAGRVLSTCVIDGDTIRVKGTRIRIADIDTPEVFSPRCLSERVLGNRATTRLAELLNAGPVDITGYERDEDIYGRKLRILERDGQSLGAVLVAEGLARPWDGARRNWCGQGS